MLQRAKIRGGRKPRIRNHGYFSGEFFSISIPFESENKTKESICRNTLDKLTLCLTKANHLVERKCTKYGAI